MTDALHTILEAVARQDMPPTIALMQVLMEAPDEALARMALAEAVSARRQAGNESEAARLQGLIALWLRTPDAWRVVRTVIDGIAHDHEAAPADTLHYWAEAFDRLVVVSPEASVALYSLGSPTLLAEATDEIVAAMARWDLVTRRTDVLDIGCGIGRFATALAPLVRSVVGLDIAPNMIAEARRRCGHLRQVRFSVSNGRDLDGIADASVDLALAADVFPYVVQAGPEAAGELMAEIARVLRPGGHLLILNYSYRGDRGHDQADVTAQAERRGFRVERDGTREFRFWDGTTFLLRAP